MHSQRTKFLSSLNKYVRSALVRESERKFFWEIVCSVVQIVIAPRSVVVQVVKISLFTVAVSVQVYRILYMCALTEIVCCTSDETPDFTELCSLVLDGTAGMIGGGKNIPG